MRLIIQRVNRCRVINNKTNEFNEINKGLLVYVSISKDCNLNKIEKVANKLVKLRVFPKNNKNFEISVKDIKGDILLISNFTLFGFLKGNRPNFKNSLEFNLAKKLYDKFVYLVKNNYVDNKVKTGFFGKNMSVESEVDGPFNLVLDF